MNIEQFKAHINESIEVKRLIFNDVEMMGKIEQAVSEIVKTYIVNGKVLFCGNGGSAADAQHLAAELSGRYNYDRPPLYAEALHVNSSYLTAVANDYSFDLVYSRMTEAAGRKGDVLVAFSTSGNSKNILHAVRKAYEIGMFVIVFTGNKMGIVNEWANVLFDVPSSNTPIIQESHIMIGHIICEWVEKEMFPIHE